MKLYYKHFASWTAVLAGLSSLVYAYFFIVVKDPKMYSLFLTVSGLLALIVALALYDRIKGIDPTYSKVATVLLALGSFGAFVHGGYDLANAINPVAAASAAPNLPSQIDPRGLLAFGLSGLGILKVSLIMAESKDFEGLSLLGILSGVLLIVIYLARLTVLSPTNPWLLYPVLLEGFVVNPVWYLWLGLSWSRK